jgi:hypothetical protein
MLKIVVHKYKRIDGFINNAYPRTKDWGSHFEDIPLALLVLILPFTVKAE